MDYRDIINEKLDELALEDLESVLDDNFAESEQIFGDFSTRTIIDSIIDGEELFSTGEIINRVTELFTYELKSVLALSVEIIAVAILIGLLKNVSSSFGDKAVSNLGMIVSTFFIIGLCITNFSETFNMCSDAVGTMSHTMQILLPVMIPLLIAIGGITSGGLMSPVIMATITAFNTIMSGIILPAIFISTIFFMINSMTERDYVSRLAGFVRNAALFLCGISVTFFTGITVIQGFVAESADGLIVETARYSVNNLVPIVGGFAADSVDLLIMCIRTIKNGIGIAGIVILLTAMIVPIIKLIAVAAMYKITSIITEPLGNKQITECLSQMGNAVITMSVLLFLTSVMFLIFVTVIISLGS